MVLIRVAVKQKINLLVALSRKKESYIVDQVIEWKSSVQRILLLKQNVKMKIK